MKTHIFAPMAIGDMLSCILFFKKLYKYPHIRKESPCQCFIHNYEKILSMSFKGVTIVSKSYGKTADIDVSFSLEPLKQQP